MLVLYLLLVAVCCVAIWKISDIFEDATEYLGRNMSNGVRGASLNAIGSSMPELLTSVIFLFYMSGSEGYAGTIGTTAGSAIFNILLIPAVVILVVFIMGIASKTKGVETNPKIVRRDGAFLLLSESALILLISGNSISLIDAIILVLIYIIYSFVLYKQGKSKAHSYIEGSKEQTLVAWGKLSFSVALMSITCFALVFSVEKIGVLIDIPLIFVSIILASAATSVPDTIISVKDGLKGNYDDAMSNALGSNIFDICIANGLPLFVYILIYGPITMSYDTTAYCLELRIALLIVTAIVSVIYLVKKRFFITQAYQLIILYVLFISYAILRAYGVNVFNL